MMHLGSSTQPVNHSNLLPFQSGSVFLHQQSVAYTRPTQVTSANSLRQSCMPSKRLKALVRQSESSEQYFTLAITSSLYQLLYKLRCVAVMCYIILPNGAKSQTLYSYTRKVVGWDQFLNRATKRGGGERDRERSRSLLYFCSFWPSASCGYSSNQRTRIGDTLNSWSLTPMCPEV